MKQVTLALLITTAPLLAQERYQFETVLPAGNYQAIFDGALNSSGDIALYAQIAVGQREFLRVSGGIPQVLIDASQGYNFTRPQVAENGDMLAIGALGGGQHDLFVWDDSQGQLVLIADITMVQALVPGSGNVSSNAHMNESGDVALMTAGTPDDHLFAYRDGVLELVASAPSNEIIGYWTPAMDDSGAVYAIAALASPTNALGLVEVLPGGVPQVVLTEQDLDGDGDLDTRFEFSYLDAHQGKVRLAERVLDEPGSSLDPESRLIEYDVATGQRSIVLTYGGADEDFATVTLPRTSFDCDGGIAFPGQGGIFSDADPGLGSIVSQGQCVVGWPASIPNTLLSPDAVDSMGRILITFSGFRMVLATPLGNPAPQPGASICLGFSCPCANPSTGCLSGCGNSSGFGSNLRAFGSPSLAANELLFQGSDLAPGQPALLFAADTKLNGNSGQVFGNGRRCAGGTVQRLGVGFADGVGSVTWPSALGGLAFPASQSIVFQAWYRDPTPHGSCTAGFNLSNGYEITLAP